MPESSQCDLSVILPAYNAAEFIVPAIRSVLDQIPAGRSVEVLVVDDGSTDGTGDAVTALGESDRVRYFRKENQGPSAARNLGLAQSRGELLMMLDADDALCPGCLGVTLDFMDRHPGVGFFFTNYEIYDEHGVVHASAVDIWRRFRQLARREEIADEWVFTESLTPHIIEAGGFMHTSGLTIRRSVYAAIGPFQTGYSYGEDDEFYARATYSSAAGYVDRVLSRKRNHAASLIHNPSNRLRNTHDLLALLDIQIEQYRHDPEIVRILNRKIPRVAENWVWLLIMTGQSREARKIVRRYLSRYPRHPALYRLWLRSWFRA